MGDVDPVLLPHAVLRTAPGGAAQHLRAGCACLRYSRRTQLDYAAIHVITP